VLQRLFNHKITLFMLRHTFTLLRFIFIEDKKSKKFANPLLLMVY